MPLEQMASHEGNIASGTETENSIFISRRCIILTVVASTPTENIMLDLILKNGYLSTVNCWVNDILRGTLGEFVPSHD